MIEKIIIYISLFVILLIINIIISNIRKHILYKKILGELTGRFRQLKTSEDGLFITVEYIDIDKTKRFRIASSFDLMRLKKVKIIK